MSDDFLTDPFDAQPPSDSRDIRHRDYRDDDRRSVRFRRSAPLPSWLARRLLRDGEQVTFVAGPRFNPSWEKYVTHPLLFLAALGLGVLCVGTGRLTNETWAGACWRPP